MSDTSERLAEALVIQFWAVVDEILDIPGAMLFLPEGTLRIEAFKAEGANQLAAYFAGRREKSASQSRITRHVISNLRYASGLNGAPIVDCLVTVFSGYGSRPAPLGPPSSLADFTFDFGTDGAGEMKLAAVSGRLIFAGSDTPDLKAAQESTGTENG